MGMLLRRHREEEINRRREVKTMYPEETSYTETDTDPIAGGTESGKRKRKVVNTATEDSTLSE